MSTNEFITKEGDTRPIEGVLEDRNGPVDLTGSTVRFKLQDLDEVQIIDAVATIVDAVNGEVKYTFQAADIVAMGAIDNRKEFSGEWHVTFPDATEGTFPNDDYIPFIVLEDRG